MTILTSLASPIVPHIQDLICYWLEKRQPDKFLFKWDTWNTTSHLELMRPSSFKNLSTKKIENWSNVPIPWRMTIPVHLRSRWGFSSILMSHRANSPAARAECCWLMTEDPGQWWETNFYGCRWWHWDGVTQGHRINITLVKIMWEAGTSLPFFTFPRKLCHTLMLSAVW